MLGRARTFITKIFNLVSLITFHRHRWCLYGGRSFRSRTGVLQASIGRGRRNAVNYLTLRCLWHPCLDLWCVYGLPGPVVLPVSFHISCKYFESKFRESGGYRSTQTMQRATLIVRVQLVFSLLYRRCVNQLDFWLNAPRSSYYVFGEVRYLLCFVNDILRDTPEVQWPRVYYALLFPNPVPQSLVTILVAHSCTVRRFVDCFSLIPTRHLFQPLREKYLRKSQIQTTSTNIVCVVFVRSLPIMLKWKQPGRDHTQAARVSCVCRVWHARMMGRFSGVQINRTPVGTLPAL